ncbi:hypothetical protein [Bdellovibrio sp. NC01]|uniref:hypothetical protein n=1 Tax=Bdellovibrio sp. NC01 TaxID=2220073 RepID=UPI001157E986|nr:hypothetical protein [Bdellovibrio sp. NC01]QDK36934.1 hypothetical protein DOE51_04675 [Bdellovibrio sp. NC01]
MKALGLSLLILFAMIGSACSLSKNGEDKNSHATSENQVREESLVGKDQTSQSAQRIQKYEEQLIENVVKAKIKEIRVNVEGPSLLEAPSKEYKEFDEKIASVFQSLKMGDLNSAADESKKLGLSCADLEASLLHQYVLKGVVNFNDVSKLIRDISCENSASANQMQVIYNLEVRRQFFEKFKDPSVLKYALNQTNFKKLKSPLFAVGDTGVSLSLPVLYRIWDACSMGIRSDEQYPAILCSYYEDNSEGEKAFKKELGIEDFSTEIRIIKDNRLIYSSTWFRVTRAFSYNFAELLFEYMSMQKKFEGDDADLGELALSNQRFENMQ